VKVLPITEKNIKYGQKVVSELISPTSPRLRGTTIRAELDSRNQTLQAKIRDAQLEKIPYMLVAGDKEQKQNKVAVRLRSGKDLGQVPLQTFIKRVQDKVDNKSLDL
jgi:threonyl-tRNA synthetase